MALVYIEVDHVHRVQPFDVAAPHTARELVSERRERAIKGGHVDDSSQCTFFLAEVPHRLFAYVFDDTFRKIKLDPNCAPTRSVTVETSAAGRMVAP